MTIRHLVLGVNDRQLTQWALDLGCEKLFAQTMVAIKGQDTYHLIVSRPNDIRVQGMEFQSVIPLPGINAVEVDYMLRVRPRKV